MRHEFLLPDVGEGLSQAEVVEWHVAVGAAIAEDDPLVDVQTDKAIVTIPAPATGVVGELCADVGDTIPIGGVLAVFEVSDADAVRDGGSSAPVPQRPAPAAPGRAMEATAPGSGTLAAALPPQASPAVRRLAREQGVDLRKLAGSGPGGRILREDVESFAGRAAIPPARANGMTTSEVSDPPAPGQTIPMGPLRRAISRTLSEAWRTVPHVIDYREVDFTAIVELRARLKQEVLGRGDEQLAASLSMTPLLLKVAAAALRRHPLVNSSLSDDERQIHLHAHCHLGVATATPAGLLVPVVRDVDRKSVHELASETAGLLERVRRGAAAPQDLTGATFTVNNYGSLGIWLGTPIVTPPQVANLGLGEMRQRPVVVDGEVVARPIVALACSADHRVLDGDTLAAFVTTVAQLLEHPELLLGGLH